MIDYSWNEQGGNQYTCQSGQRKAMRPSSYTKLQATEECRVGKVFSKEEHTNCLLDIK